jgi:hypothetical protein
MMKTVRSWQLLVGSVTTGVVVVLGFSGATATAEPVLPSPPTPGHAPAAAAAPAVPAAVPVPTVAAGPAGDAATAAAPSALVPARSGTLRDYFAEKGVRLEPQQPAGLTALDITLPVPTGWTQVPDPNVPDAFAVIADRHSGGLYTPNAQVVVYRLVGHFGAGEAITHGYIDSQQLPAWQTTNASLADFGGFPSSLIEGTYRQNDMTLNTSQRHVVAASGADSYLVSIAVTTGVSEAVRSAPATDAIVNGFRVTVPGTVPAAPAAAPGPVAPRFPASAPAAPALPSVPRAGAAGWLNSG